MVLKNTPLRHPLGKTICLFGQIVYKDTKFFNDRQGVAPLPLLHYAYEVRQYRLA